ncbi:hypothetical protein PACTADRAFT_16106 [Pachysolen tannophilus NRRL Y-2460]|uniref:Protein kinase domain-containing protein n=1 Tax=Pachysolen tannophilus NRRL Y-2460 TaxID=669874 RepID=A0A1E4TVY0_PACTA|nr:hypothetical protein PACTADRAFT_16106 [Pachysolen tannophilus NRRL Y-2460]
MKKIDTSVHQSSDGDNKSSLSTPTTQQAPNVTISTTPKNVSPVTGRRVSNPSSTISRSKLLQKISSPTSSVNNSGSGLNSGGVSGVLNSGGNSGSGANNSNTTTSSLQNSISSFHISKSGRPQSRTPSSLNTSPRSTATTTAANPNESTMGISRTSSQKRARSRSVTNGANNNINNNGTSSAGTNNNLLSPGIASAGVNGLHRNNSNSNLNNVHNTGLNLGSHLNITSTSTTNSGRPSRRHSIIQSNLNSKSNEQYLQQEKVYLRKMQEKNKNNKFVRLIDDYYTKGITTTGEEEDEDEEEDEEEEDEEDDNDDDDEDFEDDDDNIENVVDFETEADRDNCLPLKTVYTKFNNRDHQPETSSKIEPVETDAAVVVVPGAQQQPPGGEVGALGQQQDDKNYLINPNNLANLSVENNLPTVDDTYISERLEWQSMLRSVLTGDVVKSEKIKIIVPMNENESESYLHATYKDNLWIGIKSKIYGRTSEEQKKLILYKRSLADETINKILNFKLEYKDQKTDKTKEDDSYFPSQSVIKERTDYALEQVTAVLDEYESIQDLWRTQKEMRNEKPACGTPEFEDRVDALIAWKSIVEAINREESVLKAWVGNDDLDILRKATASTPASPLNTTVTPSTKNNIDNEKKIFRDDSSFVERILKEKDVKLVFDRRIFSNLGPWVAKARDSFLELRYMFELLNLPIYLQQLLNLALFPLKLIKELINVRLVYAKKLKNPTMMMIDQMIDDFRTYLELAMDIRVVLMEYCFPQEGWVMENYIDPTFDQTVLNCVHYYLFLLNRKLLDSSRSPKTFRTFKEPEELEKQWNFLQNLGYYIDGGGLQIAEQFSSLTSKLISRLLTYIQTQFQGPSTYNKNELVRWYTSAMENFGALRRKFTRFSIMINQYFQNSLVFNLQNNKLMKKFLENLKITDHFLIYTGTIEKQGVYLIASGNLFNKQGEILKILNGSQLGVDINKIPESHLKILRTYTEFFDNSKKRDVDADDKKNENDETPNKDSRSDFGRRILATVAAGISNIKDEDEDHEPGYILAIRPTKPIVWNGKVVNLDLDTIPLMHIKPGKLLLITQGGSVKNLSRSVSNFLDCVDDTIGAAQEKRCSLPKVEHELSKINRTFYRMVLTVLDSMPMARNQCKGIGDCQELVNNLFIYVRDFGRNVLRNFDENKKSEIIMKLIQLSIEWVSFIVDDCVPTEKKTFKWCVLALEFAMEMTTGLNILTLTEDQFYRLKLKVGGCMSLLISHFDVMGARSNEREKKRLLNWSLQKQKSLDLYEKDEDVLAALHEDIMKNIEVLEAQRHKLQEEQQSVGRVLDDTDTENQFLTFLASSFSSVSIRWQKGRFIGGGTFGSVYASINLDTGGVMAVKEIRFQHTQSIKNVVPAIKDEMTVLEMLSHPNIVQYFGVEVHRDKVYIFMEFCEGGSLAGLLEHGRIEDETVIQVYTLQMLEGLAYLHQSGIVHRDIKPENILLDHMGVIKYVDFGAAKVIATGGRSTLATNHSNATSTGNGSRKLNSMTGTPMYMSPEVITGSSSGRHGSVDIWSLGCCVLEMATGRRPWANLDNEWAIMYHIAAGHLPQFPSSDQLSEAGMKFLSKCLEHDPNKRVSAVELLNDPWIMNIRNEAFGDSTSSSEVGDN